MKRSGLKTKLFEAVKGAYPNEFSLESVNELCDELGKKRSNGERRLRELCEPNETGYAPVRTIRNEKDFIVGYVYQEPPRLEFKKNISIEFGGQQGQLAGIETCRRF